MKEFFWFMRVVILPGVIYLFTILAFDIDTANLPLLMLILTGYVELATFLEDMGRLSGRIRE